ncbi:MAG: SPOR domain-containing protein [Marinosulfonomonas sp.]|nr:SPOR domain-containing protein [Marinosulfonomonas sp.]
MADFEYGNAVDGGYPARGAGMSSVINWLGAVMSAGLIAGLVWWGYQLMVRDVSGVPVVRALEGPMRVAPDDPGGQSARHQGLAVNNIPAAGTAADPTDRVVLAPKPTVLTTEDETTAALDTLQATAAANAANERAALVSDGSTSQETTPSATAEVARSSLIEAALLQVQDAPRDLVPASVGGVTQSLVPQLRPAVLRPARPASLIAAESAATRIDPADIPVGTRLAQLGAFETQDLALKEWATVSANFDDYMSDKALVIEKAQSGGKVFYRLRAHGFDDLSDARRFCSALMAGKANCIPVVTR